jgi:hypothetical protein
VSDEHQLYQPCLGSLGSTDRKDRRERVQRITESLLSALRGDFFEWGPDTSLPEAHRDIMPSVPVGVNRARIDVTVQAAIAIDDAIQAAVQ